MVMADNTLYFGCRSEKKDHHYADEWRNLVDANKLTYLTAFSRDEESKYRYVQDRVRDSRDSVWPLIHDKKACIYISGCVDTQEYLLYLG